MTRHCPKSLPGFGSSLLTEFSEFMMKKRPKWKFMNFPINCRKNAIQWCIERPSAMSELCVVCFSNCQQSPESLSWFLLDFGTKMRSKVKKLNFPKISRRNAFQRCVACLAPIAELHVVCFLNRLVQHPCPANIYPQ